MVKVEMGRCYDLKYGIYRGTQQLLEAGATVAVLKFKMCMARIAPVPGGPERAMWVKRSDLEAAIAL